MKKLGLLLVMIVFGAAPALSQCCTSINFPRKLTAEDRETTGFAIVNPTAEDADFTFNLYNGVGAWITSAERTVPARGQLALLASELFPGVGPTGWIQAHASGTGFASFWLGGDFTTLTDGAATPPEVLNHLLPVAGGGTEINMVNPTLGGFLATAEVFDSNGQALASPHTLGMEEKQPTQMTLQEMFPGADVSTATHLRIASRRAISAAAVFRDHMVSPSWGVINSVDSDVFVHNLHFPHVVSGDLGSADYQTQVSITNLSMSPQTVTLSFNPDEGGAPRVVEAQLAGNGTLRDTARSIFGLPDGEYHQGWLRIQGESGLGGFVAYADSVQKGLAITAAQAQPASELLFAHIADLDPWWTGIALLNDTTTEAIVEVFAMTPSGELIGGADNVPTARFTLPPESKSAKLLSELIPQTQNRTLDGGFVFVRSNGVPLYGTELFFTRSLTVLANVSASPLAPGAGYTPPAP